ncbi:MAG: ABC-type transport auxiliary lipoprotein family protein [Planctomycetota bacterium]
MRPTRPLLAALLLTLGLASCLSLGGPALEPRYFSAHAPDDYPLDESRITRTDDLIVGDVVAAAHLRERLVWTDGGHEYGYFEGWRWVELPSDALERELRRTFMRIDCPEDAPVRRVDLELMAFELERGSAPKAVLHLRATLRSTSGRILDGVDVTTERPLPGEDPGAMARELGVALTEAAERIARAGGVQDG